MPRSRAGALAALQNKMELTRQVREAADIARRKSQTLHLRAIWPGLLAISRVLETVSSFGAVSDILRELALSGRKLTESQQIGLNSETAALSDLDLPPLSDKEVVQWLQDCKRVCQEVIDYMEQTGINEQDGLAPIYNNLRDAVAFCRLCSMGALTSTVEALMRFVGYQFALQEPTPRGDPAKEEKSPDG